MKQLGADQKIFKGFPGDHGTSPHFRRKWARELRELLRALPDALCAG